MSDIWTLDDGRVGNVKQAMAVGSAVQKQTGLTYEKKTITRPSLSTRIVGMFAPAWALGDLQPPYPQLVIGCGATAVAYSLSIKAASPHVKLVQILNPPSHTKKFDLLILPRHDGRDYDNAIITDGAVTEVTPALVQEKGEAFSTAYSHLEKPIIGVLIGGDNKAYAMDSAAENHISELLTHWTQQGYNIIGSFSRRTPPSLQEKLLSLPQVNFWNGEGKNPYFGILHYADALAVTCDSINMVSESYHSGTPTYVIPLTERSGTQHKFARFHELQMQKGRVRPAAATLDFNWQPTPCDDLQRITKAVCELF